jgi:hypothetical protein
MKRSKTVQEALKIAKERQDDAAIESAQNEQNALILFKADKTLWPNRT